MLAAAPGPGQAWQSLRSGADPFAPLVACLARVAWALAAWLLLAAALTGGSRWGGRGGTACRAVLRRVAPAALRRALALALGAGVVRGAGGVASAASPVPVVARATAATDLTGPSLDWPGTPADPLPVTGPGDRAVVVRPGDTLWDLAERSLPAGATAAQVAARWPVWWSANREVIGDDPDLLHPGQALQAPPA